MRVFIKIKLIYFAPRASIFWFQENSIISLNINKKLRYSRFRYIITNIFSLKVIFIKIEVHKTWFIAIFYSNLGLIFVYNLIICSKANSFYHSIDLTNYHLVLRYLHHTSEGHLSQKIISTGLLLLGMLYGLLTRFHLVKVLQFLFEDN